jgi:phospholipase/carboxylesterase
MRAVLTLFVLAALMSCMAVFATSDNDDSLYGEVKNIPPTPTACEFIVVHLHGLGDTAAGWLDTMTQLQASRQHLCVVLPTARRMTVAMLGKETTAWFDVSESRFNDLRQEDHQVDVENVKKSAEYLMRLTRKQMKEFNVPWNRVVFSGFSQGGAMAIHLGLLSAPETTRAVISIGGFLATQSQMLALAMMGRQFFRTDTKVLLIHGKNDRVVAYEHARHAYHQLHRVGMPNVELWDSDPTLEHGLSDAALEKLKQFFDTQVRPGDLTEDM